MVGLSEAECSDSEALDRMLNPARNPYRLETLNVGVHAPLMRPLQHANFTFAKKLSHSADSQDQRHRMVPGSRPLLVLTDTADPDFITPMLIRENPRAREVYERAMQDAWAAKNELLDRGVPREFALYLLPNAKAIRLVESGSLLHLLHKWTMRTCFNAQEEIYQASMEEVAQVRAALPELGPLHRSAVLCARRHCHSDLHRGLAFLRRQSLAGVPQDRAPHMTRRGTLAYYLAAWVIGCFVVVCSAMGRRGVRRRNSDRLDSADHVLFLSRFSAPSAILLFAFLLRTMDAAAGNPRSVGLDRVGRGAGSVADFSLDPCAKRSAVDSFGSVRRDFVCRQS